MLGLDSKICTYSNGKSSRHRINRSSGLGSFERHLPARASSSSLRDESDLESHAMIERSRGLNRRLGEVNCQSGEHGNCGCE